MLMMIVSLMMILAMTPAAAVAAVVAPPPPPTTTTTTTTQLTYKFVFTADSCLHGSFPNVAETNNRTSNAAWNMSLQRNNNNNMSSTLQCAPTAQLGVSSIMTVNGSMMNDPTTLSLTTATTTTPQSSFLETIATQASGLSLELWFATTTTDSSSSTPLLETILAIGSSSSSSNLLSGNDTTTTASVTTMNPSATSLVDTLDVCRQNGVDLLLAQQGTDELVVWYRTSDPYFTPCQMYSLGHVLRVSPSSSALSSNQSNSNSSSISSQSNNSAGGGPINHIVISFTDHLQQFIVNGQALPPLQQPFSNNLNQWNLQQDGLFLFHHPAPSSSSSSSSSFLTTTTVWRGTLYQLAIYAGALTFNQAHTLLAQGLPSTPDYAVAEIVTMNEDAEPGPPGSHDTAWYRTPPPVSGAASIALTIGSLEQRVSDLVQAAGLTYARPLPPPPHVYITGLPASGCLYLTTSGKKLGCDAPGALTAASILYEVKGTTTTPPSVVYLPVFNQYSEANNVPLANFSYCVSETPILSPHQCQSAVVSIVVESVNDPPIATAVGPFTVSEGLASSFSQSPQIQLTGTDVDVGDFIELVQITVPPRLGYLTLSVGTFRSDNLTNGVRLSAVNDTVHHGTDLVFVRYVYDDPTSTNDIVVKDDDVTDQFTFRVADSHGRWSEEQVVEIQIVSALISIAPATLLVPADASRGTINVVWHGNDTSGYQRSIGFLVESVPNPSLGVLLDGATQQVVQPGDFSSQIDRFPYLAGAAMTFVPSPNYCTEDPSSLQDSWISFRVVAFDGNNTTVVSMSDLQHQSVVVECPVDDLTLSGPSSQVSAMTMNPLYETLDASKAAINGIQVTTKDAGSADFVTVVVLSGPAFMTFSRVTWSRVVPIHGRNALQQGNITFLASPKDLTDIFQDFFVQSLDAGEFQVTILLQYGDCSAEGPISSNAQPMQSVDCQILRRDVALLFRDGEIRDVRSKLLDWRWAIGLLFISIALASSLALYGYLESRWILRKDELTQDVPLWLQLRNPDNDMFYYMNTDTGEVTYQPPLNEEFVPWDEERQ